MKPTKREQRALAFARKTEKAEARRVAAAALQEHRRIAAAQAEWDAFREEDQLTDEEAQMADEAAHIELMRAAEELGISLGS